MSARKLMVLALLLMSVLVSACGKEKPVPPPPEPSIPVPVFEEGTTMRKIQDSGRIAVGVVLNQRGVGFRDPATGEISGFDIEMAKLMSQGIFGGTLSEAAKRVDYVESVGQNREAFLKERSVDIVIANYQITDARKQQVDFAGPYYFGHGDIVVAAKDFTMARVTDLNGRRVCTVRNAPYLSTLGTIAPQTNLSTADTYARCLDQLRNKTVQAVTGDDAVLAALVLNSEEFRRVDAPYTDDPYGIGITKGDEPLRKFLNDRIEAVQRSGQWQASFEATLGKLGLTTPEPPPIDRYATTASPSTSAPSSSTTVPASVPPTSSTTTPTPTPTPTPAPTTSSSTTTPTTAPQR